MVRNVKFHKVVVQFAIGEQGIEAARCCCGVQPSCKGLQTYPNISFATSLQDMGQYLMEFKEGSTLRTVSVPFSYFT